MSSRAPGVIHTRFPVRYKYRPLFTVSIDFDGLAETNVHIGRVNSDHAPPSILTTDLESPEYSIPKIQTPPPGLNGAIIGVKLGQLTPGRLDGNTPVPGARSVTNIHHHLKIEEHVSSLRCVVTCLLHTSLPGYDRVLYAQMCFLVGPHDLQSPEYRHRDPYNSNIPRISSCVHTPVSVSACPHVQALQLPTPARNTRRFGCP